MKAPEQRWVAEPTQPSFQHQFPSRTAWEELEGTCGSLAMEDSSPSALPGFLPRGTFFTDTSESESESDLVMSTVSFSSSESTLESESDPESTFCEQRREC